MRLRRLRRAVHILGQRLLLLGVATVVVYLSVATVSRGYQLYQLKLEGARLGKDIAALRTRQEALVLEKTSVTSDAFVEKVAREELNLIKPGEIAVIVLSPQYPPTSERKREASTMPLPNWRRWWDLFF